MYPGLDTVNATNNTAVLLVYANDLTGGALSPMILVAFFIIIMLGSFFMQLRFSGRGRIEMSFAAAGFTTFGFAVLLATVDGLINKSYVFISLAVAIIGAAWIMLSQD